MRNSTFAAVALVLIGAVYGILDYALNPSIPVQTQSVVRRRSTDEESDIEVVIKNTSTEGIGTPVGPPINEGHLLDPDVRKGLETKLFNGADENLRFDIFKAAKGTYPDEAPTWNQLVDDCIVTGNYKFVETDDVMLGFIAGDKSRKERYDKVHRQLIIVEGSDDTSIVSRIHNGNITYTTRVSKKVARAIEFFRSPSTHFNSEEYLTDRKIDFNKLYSSVMAHSDIDALSMHISEKIKFANEFAAAQSMRDSRDSTVTNDPLEAFLLEDIRSYTYMSEVLCRLVSLMGVSGEMGNIAFPKAERLNESSIGFMTGIRDGATLYSTTPFRVKKGSPREMDLEVFNTVEFQVYKRDSTGSIERQGKSPVFSRREFVVGELSDCVKSIELNFPDFEEGSTLYPAFFHSYDGLPKLQADLRNTAEVDKFGNATFSMGANGPTIYGFISIGDSDKTDASIISSQHTFSDGEDSLVARFRVVSPSGMQELFTSPPPDHSNVTPSAVTSDMVGWNLRKGETYRLMYYSHSSDEGDWVEVATGLEVKERDKVLAPVLANRIYTLQREDRNSKTTPFVTSDHGPQLHTGRVMR